MTTKATGDGWIKYFVENEEEEGWDDLVRAEEASWSKGRLDGMCRVDLYVGNKVYTLRSGTGEVRIEPTDEELEERVGYIKKTIHPDDLGKHYTEEKRYVSQKSLYESGGDFAQHRHGQMDRAGIFWQVDDYISKFASGESSEGQMVTRRLFRLIEPADVGRPICHENEPDHLDVYLGEVDHTDARAIRGNWVGKWITLEVDLLTDTWKIRIVEKEG